MQVAMIGQKGIPARIGGIERHVEELSRGLVGRGIGVTVYTRPHYTSRAKKSYRGVRLFSLPSLHTKHLDTISHTLLATIRAMRSGADILHYHGVGPALLAWLPRIFTPGKRVVVTFHCIDRRHEKWGLVARMALGLGEFLACRAAHETIAVSRTLQHYAENLYRAEVKYIPNGFSSPGVASLKLLKKMGLQPRGYVLVVTRFVRHKGVHTVLAAWEKLSKLPSYKKMELVLVGGAGEKDSYTQEIRNFAGRLERVRILGVKEGDQLATLYRYARLFVHASVSEGLPIVLLEAMAAGTPVLASDIPEHMELIAEHGWHFPARDPELLARTIRRLTARQRLVGARARVAEHWVKQNFRWEKIVEETIRVYARLCLAPKKTPALARAQ